MSQVLASSANYTPPREISILTGKFRKWTMLGPKRMRVEGQRVRVSYSGRSHHLGQRQWEVAHPASFLGKECRLTHERLGLCFSSFSEFFLERQCILYFFYHPHCVHYSFLHVSSQSKQGRMIHRWPNMSNLGEGVKDNRSASFATLLLYPPDLSCVNNNKQILSSKNIFLFQPLTVSTE